MKHQYHEAVWCVEIEDIFWYRAPQADKSILTSLTEKLNSLRTESYGESGMDTGLGIKSEPNVIRNEFFGQNMCHLNDMRSGRGVNLRGWKDLGVLDPPRNQVKVNQESVMVHAI